MEDGGWRLSIVAPRRRRSLRDFRGPRSTATVASSLRDGLHVGDGFGVVRAGRWLAPHPALRATLTRPRPRARPYGPSAAPNSFRHFPSCSNLPARCARGEQENIVVGALPRAATDRLTSRSVLPWATYMSRRWRFESGQPSLAGGGLSLQAVGGRRGSE